MAWSEAARKAAAEARKHHAHAKADSRSGKQASLAFGRYIGDRSLATPEARKELAAKLREYRAKGDGLFRSKSVFLKAAASTKNRNITRKITGRK